MTGMDLLHSALYSVDMDYEAIDFIYSVPPKKSISFDPLPPIHSSKTHTLVLDLDETLLHFSTSPLPYATCSFSLEANDLTFQLYGGFRPHLNDFLKFASENFELVVFTASHSSYAQRIVSLIDPLGEYITHTLSRDSCFFVGGSYLKDLTILGRDLSKTIIIDNCPQSFAYHPSNGIHIRPWYLDPSDCHLVDLQHILLECSFADDVRDIIRRNSLIYHHVLARCRITGYIPPGFCDCPDLDIASPIHEPSLRVIAALE